jgi:hypothetical protein
MGTMDGLSADLQFLIFQKLDDSRLLYQFIREKPNEIIRQYLNTRTRLPQ